MKICNSISPRQRLISDLIQRSNEVWWDEEFQDRWCQLFAVALPSDQKVEYMLLTFDDGSLRRIHQKIFPRGVDGWV